MADENSIVVVEPDPGHKYEGNIDILTAMKRLAVKCGKAESVDEIEAQTVADIWHLMGANDEAVTIAECIDSMEQSDFGGDTPTPVDDRIITLIPEQEFTVETVNNEVVWSDISWVPGDEVLNVYNAVVCIDGKSWGLGNIYFDGSPIRGIELILLCMRDENPNPGDYYFRSLSRATGHVEKLNNYAQCGMDLFDGTHTISVYGAVTSPGIDPSTDMRPI